MSIHFISGKPGGGKSLYSVRLIVEELLAGHRVVITNVPLKLDALHAYVQQQAGDRVVDVIGRVWILDDDQTKEFWTYRPNGVRISRLSQSRWQAGEVPSYKAVNDSGVMYVIDEVHNFFGSRQWAETGRDVLFYLSQHRKLGDTVVCITQAVGNVDKQFRSVTQDFTYIRNLSKERIGAFRLPGIFLRSTYPSPPTETAVPMERGRFTLDVSGIAGCYDSAAGVGIHGRMADMGERKKGLPWWAFFVALTLVVWLIASYAPSAIASFFRTDYEKKGGVVSSSRVVSASSVPQLVDQAAAPPALSAVVSRGPETSTNVFITGMSRIGVELVHIALSNGKVIKFPQDRGVTDISTRHIVYRGVRYEFQ